MSSTAKSNCAKKYDLVPPTLPGKLWRSAALTPVGPVKLLVYISDCSVRLSSATVWQFRYRE